MDTSLAPSTSSADGSVEIRWSTARSLDQSVHTRPDESRYSDPVGLGGKWVALLVGCIASFGCGRIGYVVLPPDDRDSGVHGDGGGIRDAAPRDSAGTPDGGAMDAGAQDAAVVCTDPTMPCSCLAGTPGADHGCGASGDLDCCGSFEIPTESFNRDGNTMYPAVVSGFRLDAFHVTVGRFRTFVAAAVAGWVPSPGSGKHAYLNGGMGLANSGTDGGFETGWQAAWDGYLPTTQAAWDAELSRNMGPWTYPGVFEYDPITFVNWYEAYAFCIWDHGFLPSEAEWNDAAQGGDADYPCPWGTAPLSPSLSVYNFNASGLFNMLPVGSLPTGNARWGQSDMSGEAWEWMLDGFESPYATTTCNDCADLSPAQPMRTMRGGCSTCSNGGSREGAQSHWDKQDPSAAHSNNGFRCARAP